MDVHITYETLFDLLRKERSLQELQNLDKEFWSHVVGYLNDRIDFMKTTSLSEQEKNRIQLQNIKRIIREIYEHRQRKIVNLAINAVHSDIVSQVDTRSMLSEEKVLFDRLTDVLMTHRQGVLLQVMNNSLPIAYGVSSGEVSLSNDEGSSVADSAYGGVAGSSDIGSDGGASDSDVVADAGVVADGDADSGEGNGVDDSDKSNNMGAGSDADEEPEEEILVKFTSSVPKFLGKDKQVFGPYEEGTIISLPKLIVNILLKKGKVQKVMAD